MRTPKGRVGPKKVDGEFIEGSCHSRQVPSIKAKSDPQHLKDLQSWLESHKPKGLHSKDGSLTKHILDIVPENDDKKIGQAKETYDPYVGLSVLDWTQFGVGKGGEASCMQSCGSLMGKTFQENPQSKNVLAR